MHHSVCKLKVTYFGYIVYLAAFLWLCHYELVMGGWPIHMRSRIADECMVWECNSALKNYFTKHSFNEKVVKVENRAFRRLSEPLHAYFFLSIRSHWFPYKSLNTATVP